MYLTKCPERRIPLYCWKQDHHPDDTASPWAALFFQPGSQIYFSASRACGVYLVVLSGAFKAHTPRMAWGRLGKVALKTWEFLRGLDSPWMCLMYVLRSAAAGILTKQFFLKVDKFEIAHRICRSAMGAFYAMLCYCLLKKLACLAGLLQKNFFFT